MRTRGRYPAPPPISKTAWLADFWGRNRIDARVKTSFSFGMVPPLSGRYTIANDNDLALAA